MQICHAGCRENRKTVRLAGYLHLDPIIFLIFLHDVNAVYFLWIFINQNSFLQVEYIQSKNISKWVFSFGYMHVNFSRAETIYRSLQDG